MSDAALATLKVSLARPRERAAAPLALAPQGARAILGLHDPLSGTPLAAAADTLFGPRGAAASADAVLWVADTGHHRLLGWPALPERDGEPASWVIGQPDFDREGRNARSEISASTLNVPTGVCACGDGLAVADAWNHRVLIWHRSPRRSHEPADVVLGQSDPASGQANRGSDRPAADTLYWPYGVFWDGANLWVADTGNRRVLRFDGLPQRHGQPADRVLGQPDFAHRDENAGGVTQATMRWPHALALWQGHLCVADAGNNRLLLWRSDPAGDMAPSDVIIGQNEIDALDHNRGEYWPSACSLNMPYGLAVHADRLFVADTANSRLLRFDSPRQREAQAVAGQASFADKGDNRWHAARRDSLCWPYALAMHGDSAIVVDSGNNRVLLWEVER
jgi:sugar lactone lactonase YvrE